MLMFLLEKCGSVKAGGLESERTMLLPLQQRSSLLKISDCAMLQWAYHACTDMCLAYAGGWGSAEGPDSSMEVVRASLHER